jgi:hypothetical protein
MGGWSAYVGALASAFLLAWRNWQPRRVQVPVPVRACGFESHSEYVGQLNGGLVPQTMRSCESCGRCCWVVHAMRCGEVVSRQAHNLGDRQFKSDHRNVEDGTIKTTLQASVHHRSGECART